ncbi:uncharacterized protein HKW66_Vig0154910 [Vigna angularis]|uniref:Uncharacterized protein n=1 Tax=Phaseolus angularis TaxID=3914 RepID=A0A8T0JP08_PHAAN|nr:uncharacterized protein HKW66_Vig0154910 [Vigna angularis]
MAPRLPPPPQPNEPDAPNNARLLETVIERLQQQNTTLMEQNAAALRSLEAARENSEATQRQLMDLIAATREVGVQNSTSHLPHLLSRNLHLLSTETHHPLLRSTFRDRRDVRGTVSYKLDRTVSKAETGKIVLEESSGIEGRKTISWTRPKTLRLGQVAYKSGMTVVMLMLAWSILIFRDTHLHVEEGSSCVGMAGEGEATLEDVIEEENLVEVEVKAEQ